MQQAAIKSAKNEKMLQYFKKNNRRYSHLFLLRSIKQQKQAFARSLPGTALNNNKLYKNSHILHYIFLIVSAAAAASFCKTFKVENHPVHA